MEISGRIKQVLAQKNGVSQRTGNAWASQQYVIEEDGVQYPQSLLFEVFGQDKIQQYHLAVGQMVKVSFSMRTRTYNGKVYNEIPRAFNVTPLQPQQPVQQYQPQPQQIPESSAAEYPLPFGRGNTAESVPERNPAF